MTYTSVYTCIICYIFYDKYSFRTALHWASKRSHKTIIAYLLSHGADKNLKTRNGEIPADLATDNAVKRLLGGEKIVRNLCEQCVIVVWKK